MAHAGGVLTLDVHPSGRIATGGRDRHVKIWEPDGRLAADLGQADDQVTRVAWTADGQAVVTGDASGAVAVRSLASPTVEWLPMPIATRPPSVALVVPRLAPARPPAVELASTTATTATGSADDLEGALARARETVSAAQGTLAQLERLAAARRGSTASPETAAKALESVRMALAALRAAVAADLDLARALAETERTLRQREARATAP